MIIQIKKKHNNGKGKLRLKKSTQFLVLFIGLTLTLYYLDKNLNLLPKQAARMDHSDMRMNMDILPKSIQSKDSLYDADFISKQISAQSSNEINVLDNKILLNYKNSNTYLNEPLLKQRMNLLNSLFKNQQYDLIIRSIKKLEPINYAAKVNNIEKKISGLAVFNIIYTHSQYPKLYMQYGDRSYEFLTNSDNVIDIDKTYFAEGYMLSDKIVITKITEANRLKANALPDKPTLFSIGMHYPGVYNLDSNVDTTEELEAFAKNQNKFFSRESYNRYNLQTRSKVVVGPYTSCVFGLSDLQNALIKSGFFNEIKDGDLVQLHRTCDRSFGGAASTGRYMLTKDDGTKASVGFSIVAYAMDGIAAHENSHTFGQGHSGAFPNCQNPILEKCTNISEYGDKRDSLGGGGYITLVAARRDYMGFFKEGEVLEITKGTTKDILLDNIYSNTSQIKAIKFTVKPSLMDQVNYPADFKVLYFVENYNNEVLIHMRRPKLVWNGNMPTLHGDDVVSLNKSSDQALNPGEVFYDNINNLTIKYKSVSGNFANLTINYDDQNGDDITPPVISYEPIQSGYTVTGTINIKVGAADRSGISLIEILLNNNKVASCSNVSTCVYSWESVRTQNGKSVVTMTATDKFGNIYNISVNVIVSNTENPPPPGLSGISPPNGWEITLPTTFIWTLSGDNFLLNFGSYKGASNYGTSGYITSNSYLYNGLSSIPKGTTLYLRLFSYGRSNYYKDYTYKVGDSTPPPGDDKTPPAISISSPSNGSTVKGSVTVSTSSTDASGISSHDILIDNSVVKSCSSSTSCSYTWDTTKYSNASHVIKVNSTDTKGNNGSSSISVTVSNGTNPPPPSGGTSEIIDPIAYPKSYKFLVAPTTFTWTKTEGATYDIYFGSSAGYTNIGKATNLTDTSYTINSYPANIRGKFLYVRLYTKAGSTTTYKDYIFIVN